MSTAQALDPLRLPLAGTELIEASAGTGKTWTIAALYLRLVLGHGGGTPLLPAQILVMTFTKAATAELRERIRTRLAEAAETFREQRAPDDFLRALIAEYPGAEPRNRAARQLELAAQSMDEAAVFTIHGWCQRMLSQHAFASGEAASADAVADEAELLAEAVRDYWRGQVFTLGREAAALYAQSWDTPAALQAAYGGGASCFILFSSSGMYGDDPDDDVWIDEDTPPTPDHAMQNIQSDELEMERCAFDRMKLVTLRLAPVYGPGRGVRNRIRKGDYRILDAGQHVTSRIHVDDVVRIVAAAEEKAPSKSVFLLADDAPTTQGEYATWLAERMKVPVPPHRQQIEPGKTKVAHRNRKIRNKRVKETLGIELLYPSFREGEAAIEAEEGTGA